MLWIILALAVGFVAGLLVGRRNPKIADAAAVGANVASAEAQKLADKAKQ